MEHEVGDELLAARHILARGDDDFLDAGMLRDARLDFAELDAETANFDLMIEPAEQFDLPLGAQPRDVACLI